MNRSVLISGCSGGGKSTLLAELAARGHAVVEEPGRRIVKQELEGDGAALPWSTWLPLPAAQSRWRWLTTRRRVSGPAGRFSIVG
ncbi:AAA family ATPase [Rhizobium leguminosarum]|uniref:AAA family ATPase n=1 Tax=Rhizobium leguminosarum TaxID=384 RepID=UPI0039658C19